jgi:hypothetical protein
MPRSAASWTLGQAARIGAPVGHLRPRDSTDGKAGARMGNADGHRGGERGIGLQRRSCFSADCPSSAPRLCRRVSLPSGGRLWLLQALSRTRAVSISGRLPVDCHPDPAARHGGVRRLPRQPPSIRPGRRPPRHSSAVEVPHTSFHVSVRNWGTVRRQPEQKTRCHSQRHTEDICSAVLRAFARKSSSKIVRSPAVLAHTSHSTPGPIVPYPARLHNAVAGRTLECGGTLESGRCNTTRLVPANATS